MPMITDSVEELIGSTPTSPSEHLLVMVDETHGKKAYCLFMASEFSSPQPDGVYQLFYDSMNALSHPSMVYFSKEELPILTQVGPFEVTIITRDSAGKITIQDGRGEPVESHLGVDG